MDEVALGDQDESVVLPESGEHLRNVGEEFDGFSEEIVHVVDEVTKHL